MSVYLYYRKSIDKMVLVNTEPSEDWKKYKTVPTWCELYITEPIIFDRPLMSLVPRGAEQKLVAWAIKIDTRDFMDEETDQD